MRTVEVRNVLGVGTRGIVYRATDEAADLELAIREYFPAHLAARSGPLSVAPRSADDADAYAHGLRYFVDQAGRLSRVQHPSLVGVAGAWQDNGTAYMAMTLCTGRSLVDVVRLRGKAPSETWIRATLEPLLDALEQMHRAGLRHGDITPSAILIGIDGRPVLLDNVSPRLMFAPQGAQRDADRYAPIEAFRPSGGAAEGVSGDFYALGAVLHYLIAGKPPPAAPLRSDDDRPGLQLRRPDGRHSTELLGVIDWMLALKPAARPQSVAQVRAALAGKGLPKRHAVAGPGKAASRLRRRRWLWVVLGLVAAIGVGAAVLLRWRVRLPWFG